MPQGRGTLSGPPLLPGNLLGPYAYIDLPRLSTLQRLFQSTG